MKLPEGYYIEWGGQFENLQADPPPGDRRAARFSARMAYQSAGMFSEAVGRMSDMMGFHLPAQESGAELFSKQFLNASAAAGLGKHLDLRGEWQLGGVAWIRHAAMTALRPKVGVDVVSKYANHSSVAVTEFIYDLDRHARDLKALAVEPPRKIFHLGGAAIAKRGKRKKK